MLKRFPRLRSRIQDLYDRGDNRIAESQVFRLEFAKAVYAVDGERAKAVERILGLASQAEREPTPHEATEFRITLVEALCSVGAYGLGRRTTPVSTLRLIGLLACGKERATVYVLE